MKSFITLRRLVSLSVLLLLTAFPTLASPPRMSAMGMQTDTYWMIQGDNTIISLNPAELSLFSQEIWVRIKQPADFGCGVIYGLAPEANLFLSTGAPLSLTDFQGMPANPIITQEQVNLMIAFPVSKLKVGFAGMFTNVYSEDTTAGAETKNNKLVWSATGGVYFDLSEKTSLDAAVKVISYGIDYETTGTNVYSAHTFDIAAFTRLNWKAKTGNTIHAALSYAYMDRSYTPGTADLESDIINQFTLGLSDEFQLTDKTLMFIGVQGALSQNNATVGDSRDISVKVAGGMESSFTDKFTVRLGANRLFFNSIEDANAETITNLESRANVNVGLGMKLGELVFDLDINKKLFSNGPHFISGVPLNTPDGWTVDFVVTYHLDR